MGDIAQGIYSYRGIRNWKDVLEKVFTKSDCRYLTLEQSYRTTIEIMNTANKILKLSNLSGIVFANPVVRHGAKPGIYRFNEKDKLIDLLIKRVNTLKKNNYNTIAVICKTDEECNNINRLLEKKNEPAFKKLNSDDINYEGGTVIVPSYLAKGLEFDAVIIFVVNEDYLIEELDIKLLYVAMTRALHSMDIMYLKKGMALFEQIDSNLCIRYDEG